MPTPGPTTTLTDLHPVDLPGRLQPSTLAAAADGVLAAGAVGSGSAARPGLALVPRSGSARAVPLAATSPYAKVAELFSVTVHGERITALGVAHGGAHANPRWTTWSGDVSGLTEHPQTFGTFGGEEAGVLTGVAAGPDGARIVGSWQGRTALDIAVWRSDGTRWSRLDSSGTPLANTPTLQVSGRAVSATTTGLVVAGSLLSLGAGVRQNAAVWVSAGDDRWRVVTLPEAGTRSEATAVRCAASTCWIAGYVDGRLALWSLDGDAAQRIGDLPDVAWDGDGAGPQLAAAAPSPVLAYASNGVTGVLTRSRSGWVARTGPGGAPVAALQTADRLFLITTTGATDQRMLWSAAPV